MWWFKDNDVLKKGLSVMYNLRINDEKVCYSCVLINFFGLDIVRI